MNDLTVLSSAGFDELRTTTFLAEVLDNVQHFLVVNAK